jgi:hypothetical protein
VTKLLLLKAQSGSRYNLVYEAWTDEGSVYTVSVENRKCVQPEKTVTYSSGQWGTAPQDWRAVIFTAHKSGRAPQEGLDTKTDRPSAVTWLRSWRLYFFKVRRHKYTQNSLVRICDKLPGSGVLRSRRGPISVRGVWKASRVVAGNNRRKHPSGSNVNSIFRNIDWSGNLNCFKMVVVNWMTQEKIDQNPICKIHSALVLRSRWLSEKAQIKMIILSEIRG